VSGTRWLQGSAVAVAAVAVAALPASAGAFTPAETSLVSVSSQLVQGDGFAAGGTVSAGGRYVAFISSAGNLVAGDTNNAVDVFVRDRLAGTTRRTSLAPNGSEVVGDYFDLHLSYAGTRLGFVSTAGLAPGANGRFHAFVQDVGGGGGRAVRHERRPATRRLGLWRPVGVRLVMAGGALTHGVPADGQRLGGEGRGPQAPAASGGASAGDDRRRRRPLRLPHGSGLLIRRSAGVSDFRQGSARGGRRRIRGMCGIPCGGSGGGDRIDSFVRLGGNRRALAP
jgi:hypothetical protein